jgi:hypothetical protein
MSKRKKLNNEYSGAIAQSVYGTGSVHYSYFSCTGSESSLTNCWSSTGSSCDYHYYRAGVYCYSSLHYLRESACKHTFSACIAIPSNNNIFSFANEISCDMHRVKLVYFDLATTTNKTAICQELLYQLLYS